MTIPTKGLNLPFVYYRLKSPGVDAERFVRVTRSADDAEWMAMRKELGRTFPCIVFNQTRNEVSSYVAVLLTQLRRVPLPASLVVHKAWQKALYPLGNNCVS